MDGVTNEVTVYLKDDLKTVMAEAKSILVESGQEVFFTEETLKIIETTIDEYERAIWLLLGEGNVYGSSEKSKKEIRPEEYQNGVAETKQEI